MTGGINLKYILQRGEGSFTSNNKEKWEKEFVSFNGRNRNYIILYTYYHSTTKYLCSWCR